MTRRLAAILAADIVGYSALMAEDEKGTLEALRRLRSELFHPAVAGHRGKVVKSMGDGWLVEFASATDAVNCAVRLQTGLESDLSLSLRIGVHIGDITHEDEDVYGDGVNVAARLEALAEPGTVLISDSVYGALDGTLTPGFDDAGQHRLKHIPRLVKAWVRGAMPANSILADAPGIGRADATVALTIRPVAVSDARDEVQDLAAALTSDLFGYLTHGRWMTATIAERGGEGAFVLTGTLRSRGDRLRLDFRLDDRNGAPIWTRRLDGELSDGFDWQDAAGTEIASGAFAAIEDVERARITAKDPRDMTSGECMLQAFLHAIGQPEDTRICLESIEMAIENDPDWARPYAWGTLMIGALHIAALTADFPRQVGQLEEWSRRGHALSADDPIAQLWLAQPMASCEPALEPFQTKIEAILRRWPWHHDALFWGALANVHFGEAERAELYARRVIELLPSATFTASMHNARAAASIQLGRDEEALDSIRKALEVRPRAAHNLRILAAAFANLGRMQEARDAVAQVLQIAPAMTVAGVARIYHADTPGIRRNLEALRRAGLPEGDQ